MWKPLSSWRPDVVCCWPAIYDGNKAATRLFLVLNSTTTSSYGGSTVCCGSVIENVVLYNGGVHVSEDEDDNEKVELHGVVKAKVENGGGR